MPSKHLKTSDIPVELNPELSLEELCEACGVTPLFIQELMEYGALEPKGISIETWMFDATHLKRVRTVIHLQQDLEVNLPGAALALDLMDEIEALHQQLELLQKLSR